MTSPTPPDFTKTTLPVEEFDMLRSAAAELTNVINELTDAKRKETGASKEAAEADKKKAAAANTVGDALGKFGNAALSTANAAYGLAKTFAGIAESGRQFAEKTGATATRGAQFQLDLNKIVLQDARKFGADQQVIAEQIRGAATSFADVFVGAAAGMQISARGSAEFARSLNVGFKSEFTLTAQSMKALVTVGAATTKEFDAFRKASGRAGLSSGQFANLVNKNSLSFMLYGPAFARAAVSAERLGINLASVQRAQESMVTNLDGTIDTIAQLNQLGANIDFGSLVTMAETQGPEATLKYLQSTIPPSLFQSASTRALISKLGIPLEDLLKRQGSKQESAADRIEQAFSEVAAPAGAVATSLAKLNKDIKALEENKVMEILNGVVSVGKAIWNLVTALGALIIATYSTAARLLMGGMPGLFGKKPPAVVPPKVAPPVQVPTAVPTPKVIPPTPVTPGAAVTGQQQRALEALRARDAARSIPPVPPPAPVTKLGFFARTAERVRESSPAKFITRAQKTQISPRDIASRTVSAVKASPGAIKSAVTRAPAAMGRGLLATPSITKGIITRAGPAGVGAGALSGVFGGISGYKESMQRQIESKKVELMSKAEAAGRPISEEEAMTRAERNVRLTGGRATAAGAGAIQGGAAAAGAILGGAILPFLGPVGPIVGGYLGNKLGASINEKFPGIAKSVGATFTQIKDAAMPVIEKLQELWQTIRGPLLLTLKVMVGIVGGVLFVAFKTLGFVFSKIVAPLLGVVIDAFKLLGLALILFFNFIIKTINTLLPKRFEIKELETPDWAKKEKEKSSTPPNSVGTTAVPEVPPQSTTPATPPAATPQRSPAPATPQRQTTPPVATPSVPPQPVAPVAPQRLAIPQPATPSVPPQPTAVPAPQPSTAGTAQQLSAAASQERAATNQLAAAVEQRRLASGITLQLAASTTQERAATQQVLASANQQKAAQQLADVLLKAQQRIPFSNFMQEERKMLQADKQPVSQIKPTPVTPQTLFTPTKSVAPITPITPQLSFTPQISVIPTKSMGSPIQQPQSIPPVRSQISPPVSQQITQPTVLTPPKSITPITTQPAAPIQKTATPPAPPIQLVSPAAQIAITQQLKSPVRIPFATFMQEERKMLQNRTQSAARTTASEQVVKPPITVKPPATDAGIATGIVQNSLQTTKSSYLSANSSLEKRVTELVTALTDAKTTIQIGDSTQQVPRMSVARVGAYERFGRPQ